jgi:hypothetical protein
VGAGDKDLADRANVLRLAVLAPAAGLAQSVWQIDANIDDMSPELTGAASDALFAAGAGRRVVDADHDEEGQAGVHAVGARRDRETRRRDRCDPARDHHDRGALRRAAPHRARPPDGRGRYRYGRIPVKVAMDGTTVVNAAPEYEACAAAAREHGVPVKLVFSALSQRTTHTDSAW